MNLIYISNTRLPTEKARGLQIMKSCEAFANLGLDVTLVAPFGHNPITEDPFLYYSVKRVFKLQLVSHLGFLFKLFSEKWSFYSRSVVFAVLVILTQWRYRTTAIFYSRDYSTMVLLGFFRFQYIAEIHDYRSLKPSRLIRYLLHKSRKIVVNSLGTKQSIRNHYNIIDDKILIVPNGVDKSFFNISDTKEISRDRLLIPKDDVIVGYVGSLEMVGEQKGVGELILAMESILEKKSNIRLYIIGGPMEAVSRYQKIVKNKEKIIFTGQVDYKVIPTYLRAIDIVVIPLPQNTSLAHTSSPLKVFEFMATGKAIIASDVPATSAYLNKDSTLFYKADDVIDLSNKIMTLADNPELRQRLSISAQKLADEYSWTSRAQKIASFALGYNR